MSNASSSFHALGTLWPGVLVDGKYRVERQLGRGGMGEVYLARHERLGRLVAIKVLGEAWLRDPAAHARFQREALAASRLKHLHIAEVSDLGQLPTGVPYMVMEYLEGTDLAGYFRERGPLPVPAVLEVLSQLCVGLDVAHRAGVVHRDLKPANLFLLAQRDAPPLLKILDFGIAKAGVLPVGGGPSVAAAAPLTQLTVAGDMIGSVRYMAPEQMESASDVDARADIWSMGVLGFRLLTGKFPFEGRTPEELFAAMIARPLPPLAALRPDAPAALVAAIEGCLRPDRADRWPNVGIVHAMLAGARTAQPAPAASAPAPTTAPPALTYVPSPAAERNRGIAIGALVLLVGLLLLSTGSCVAFMTYANRNAPPKAASVPRAGGPGADKVR